MLIKLFRFYFVSIFILHLLNSQVSAQTDTIWNKGTDSQKLKNLLSIISRGIVSSDQQIYLSLKSLQIAQKMNDKKSVCLSYKYLGHGYFSKSDYENAIVQYAISLKFARETADSALVSDSYYNLSNSYRCMGNYALALRCSKAALELDLLENDSAAIAESYNSIGNVFENLGYYEQAYENYLNSLKILEKGNNHLGIAQKYNNIGIIHFNLKNYSQAGEYLIRSIEICDSLGNLQEKCKPMMTMGALYQKLEKYDSALLIFNQVLDISNKFNDRYLKANVFSSLGDNYFIREEYNMSLQNYQQSLSLKLEIKDFDGIVRAYINLAKIYLQLNNFSKALNNLDMAMQYGAVVKSKRLFSDIYELYYKVYKLNGDKSNALKYHELFIGVKDSIFTRESNNRIYELQTIYDTEKKESKIEFQSLKLEKAANFRNFLITIASLILILALITYSRYRLKKKNNLILQGKNTLLEEQKQQLSIQKSEIELKNLKITDSIDYALLIQQSMLPDKQILTDAFKESFILYLPKNVVSGDFYWFYQLGQKLFVVAADCTGHGVPGAFMSLLGIEMLGEIIENTAIYEADLILNQLRKNIKKALKQDNSGNADGMDIVVCIIDKELKTIEFSGAKNPLVYVENKQLKEITGNKFSVGGESTSNEPFTKHVIYYQSPVSVYLFSDGYHSQFGGPKQKKLGSKPFRELLFNNSGKTMHEQKELLHEYLINWKKNNEQIDDILVIGIKTE